MEICPDYRNTTYTVHIKAYIMGWEIQKVVAEEAARKVEEDKEILAEAQRKQKEEKEEAETERLAEEYARPPMPERIRRTL